MLYKYGISVLVIILSYFSFLYFGDNFYETIILLPLVRNEVFWRFVGHLYHNQPTLENYYL